MRRGRAWRQWRGGLSMMPHVRVLDDRRRLRSNADFCRHDLRHTFAPWHRQAGTPTHELQRLGGWKTGAMVERYAHVAPEALQGAAARLDAMAGYVPATPNASPQRTTA